MPMANWEDLIERIFENVLCGDSIKALVKKIRRYKQRRMGAVRIMITVYALFLGILRCVTHFEVKKLLSFHLCSFRD